MPAHSFNLVAPFYDLLSRLMFGGAIGASQTRYLNRLPAEGRVLLIGGGTGQVLPAILEQTACREVVFLEASEKMLDKARAQVAGHPYADRVVFRLGTEAEIGPAEQFDVLMTYFFLDLFSPVLLRQVAGALDRALAPGGCWLVSDFVQPQGGLLRRLGASVLFSSMYLFFRVTCGISASRLPRWQNQLAELGFEPVKSCNYYHGLIQSAVYQKTSCLTAAHSKPGKD